MKCSCLITFLIVLVLLSPALADTNDYILGQVVLKKNTRLYFDKGDKDGVSVGQRVDVIFDGRSSGSAIITWVSDDISYARVDSVAFLRFLNLEPLEAKIYLDRPQHFQGGVLHLPFYYDLNLKPEQIITPYEQTVACLIYDGLVSRNSQGKIVPALAHSWDVDGNTYTFYLNTGLTFHSGKSLDAIDVAYSLNELAKASKLTPASSFVREIVGYEEVKYREQDELTGVSAPNEYTVRITTVHGFAPLLEYLAGPAGYIIPAAGGAEVAPLPIGTGPYKVTGLGPNGITLTANRDHPLDFSEGPWRPALDSIAFSRYKDLDEAALDFELGDIDVLWFDSRESRNLLRGRNFEAREYYTTSAVYIGLDMRHEYFQDFRFSQALQSLFDKESMITVLLGNSARTIDGVIPRNVSPGSSGTAEYYFSPPEATEKIRQIEGLPAQMKLAYDIVDPALKSVADYIAGQLRNVDLTTTLMPIDGRDLENYSDANLMDLYVFRYDLLVADPDAFFYPLFSSKLGGQTNLLFYTNAEVQASLEEAAILQDAQLRASAYDEISRLISGRPPVAPLYNPTMTVALRPDLAAFEVDSRGFVNFRKAYFTAGPGGR